MLAVAVHRQHAAGAAFQREAESVEQRARFAGRRRVADQLDGQIGNGRDRAVARPVVDDDHVLAVRQRLLHDRADRAFFVQRRNDDETVAGRTVHHIAQGKISTSSISRGPAAMRITPGVFARDGLQQRQAARGRVFSMYSVQDATQPAQAPSALLSAARRIRRRATRIRRDRTEHETDAELRRTGDHVAQRTGRGDVVNRQQRRRHVARRR